MTLIVPYIQSMEKQDGTRCLTVSRHFGEI